MRKESNVELYIIQNTAVKFIEYEDGHGCVYAYIPEKKEFDVANQFLPGIFGGSYEGETVTRIEQKAFDSFIASL